MGNILKEIPSEIRKFIANAFIIFIAWKLFYHILLQPTRILDNPLTDFTTSTTVQLYNSFHNEVNLYFLQNTQSNRGTTIMQGNKKIIGIDDGCNALELMVIYLAFLLCLPINKFNKLVAFILSGFLLIFLLNITRCFLLIYINFEYPRLMGFAHHYFFNTVVYIGIFFMWVRYLKINLINEKEI